MVGAPRFIALKKCDNRIASKFFLVSVSNISYIDKIGVSGTTSTAGVIPHS